MPALKGPFVGCIDEGTSSTRFIIFDFKGNPFVQVQKEFPQHYPQAGWCEHDPEDIYTKTFECMQEASQKFVDAGGDVSDIKAIGVTNQRETTVVWSRSTGKPLYNAVVWLDTRTKALVKELAEKTPTKDTKYFAKRSGLPLSTYFSAVKLAWLLKNVDAVKEAHDKDDLMVGTIDSWLLYKLTGDVNGGVHVTDVSNASRTMLMDLNTLQWDDEACAFFGVNRIALPEIRSSSEVYGHCYTGLLKGIPISGILGDQQAALVGQLCFKQGQLKNTYGTGCFMLCNTGTTPVISSAGLLTTVAYKLGKDAPAVYALEGSIAVAGSSVQWLRDKLHLISSAKEVGLYASQVENTGGVYFVPAFSGLFAPHWRDDARGTIVGMTQFTSREHICRATLEAVSFQTKELIDSMQVDSGIPIELLRVDGGMSASNELMQIQADIAGVDLERPSLVETTAFGACLAAGLAVGVWKSYEDFHTQSTFTKFTPKITKDKRDEMMQGWQKALKKSMNQA